MASSSSLPRSFSSSTSIETAGLSRKRRRAATELVTLLVETEAIVLEILREHYHLVCSAPVLVDDDNEKENYAEIVHELTRTDEHPETVEAMLQNACDVFGSKEEAWRYLCTGRCSEIHGAVAVWIAALLESDPESREPLSVTHLGRQVTDVEAVGVHCNTPFVPHCYLDTYRGRGGYDKTVAAHTILRFRFGDSATLDVDFTRAQYGFMGRSPLLPSSSSAMPIFLAPLVVASSAGLSSSCSSSSSSSSASLVIPSDGRSNLLSYYTDVSGEPTDPLSLLKAMSSQSVTSVRSVFRCWDMISALFDARDLVPSHQLACFVEEIRARARFLEA